MTQDVSELLEQASRLSAGDRARLVGGLLATLDEPDPRIEDLWKVEIEQRAEGALRGERSATPWAQAKARLGL